MVNVWVSVTLLKNLLTNFAKKSKQEEKSLWPTSIGAYANILFRQNNRFWSIQRATKPCKDFTYQWLEL